jgi:short-subunit dehydrogenase
MMRAVKWLGDFRTGSLAPPDETTRAARTAVSHLKPITLVTGGSRGIGAALAQRFAQAGSDVALIARDASELETAARAIRQATARTIITLARDITRGDAAGDMAKALIAQGFYIDVLVANAGIGLSGSFDDHAAAEIDRLIAVNISAPTRMMLAVLPEMRARRHGGILMISSLGGAVPGPYQAAYYASKAYILSLSEAVASEMSGCGVRVSVLAPGPVDTSFHAAMNAKHSLYRLLIPALSTGRTARAAFTGFQLANRVIVPGLINKALYAALRVLPHPLTVAITGTLLKPPLEKD